MERGDSYGKLVVPIHETTCDQIPRIVASVIKDIRTSNSLEFGGEGFKTMISLTHMTTN
jgi:hypothetical protein